MTASKSLSPTTNLNSALQFATRSLFTTLLFTFSWGPAFTIGAFDLRFADLLLVMLTGLFLVKWVFACQLPIGVKEVRARPMIVLLLLFAIWTFTSMFVTVTPTLTLRRIVRVWLLLILVMGVYDLRPSLKWIVDLFSVHVLLQSAVALGQSILQHDLGLRWLGEQEQMAKLGFNVLDTGSRLILRVQGLAEHPNLLAITLVVPLLVVAVYLVFGGEEALISRREEALTPNPSPLGRGGQEREVLLSALENQNPSFPRRRESILPIIALLFGIIALFFTFSRAATLGGVVAVGLLLIVGKGGTTRGENRSLSLGIIRVAQPLRIALFGGGILLVGVMLFAYRDVVLSRLDLGGSILEQTSVTERAVQNRVGLKMVQASPLIGIGAHSARERFAEFLGSETRISHTIHNTVLLISAELGLPAGILWLVILFTPPIYALRHLNTISTSALAYSVALTPYLITDFTSPASYDTPTGSLLHWLLLALWLEATTTA